MPRHATDTAKRLHIGPPASLELSAIHAAYVGQLVGYSLAIVERELILRTLRDHHGNRTHAAHVLGISVRSLRDRIHIYKAQGETVPEPGSAHPDDPMLITGLRH